MKPAALLPAVILAVLLTACGAADTAAVAPASSSAAVDPHATAVPVEVEGPGTDAVPTPAVEDEGPGTDTVPAPPVEDEGPGTGTAPSGSADVAPVYGSATPTTYRIVGVAAGEVLQARAEPDPGAVQVGTFAHDAIDVNSTGAVATAGDQQWVEVEVPGGTVGWVNARFLALQTPDS